MSLSCRTDGRWLSCEERSRTRISGCSTWKPARSVNSRTSRPTSTCATSTSLQMAMKFWGSRCGSSPTSSLSTGRPHAPDEEPQCERHLECEHRQPHDRGDRPPENSRELQWKPHDEQKRRKHAEPCQYDGNHPASQQKPREQRATDGEERGAEQGVQA